MEKYRPNIAEDCILPDSIKEVFQGFVIRANFNLLLSGTAGVGKTTIAKALCEEIGASYIVINGSDEGRFRHCEDRVRQFATTISLTSGASHKVVIIDEADNTTNDVQLSLRTLWRSSMETVVSSSLVTSSTKSLNRCTHAARLLISGSNLSKQLVFKVSSSLA